MGASFGDPLEFPLPAEGRKGEWFMPSDGFI